MYHSAWEVGEVTDLSRARQRLREAGALVGSSDHGVSLPLYAKDPDGLEFEIFWTVRDGRPLGTRPVNLEAEVARRGVRRCGGEAGAGGSSATQDQEGKRERANAKV